MAKKATNAVDDFDAFAAAEQSALQRCVVCKLPADIRALITQKQPDNSIARLARYLRSKGHKVCDSSVWRHFREGHGG